MGARIAKIVHAKSNLFFYKAIKFWRDVYKEYIDDAVLFKKYGINQFLLSYAEINAEKDTHRLFWVTFNLSKLLWALTRTLKSPCSSNIVLTMFLKWAHWALNFM